MEQKSDNERSHRGGGGGGGGGRGGGRSKNWGKKNPKYTGKKKNDAKNVHIVRGGVAVEDDDVVRDRRNVRKEGESNKGDLPSQRLRREREEHPMPREPPFTCFVSNLPVDTIGEPRKKKKRRKKKGEQQLILFSTRERFLQLCWLCLV